MTTLRDHVAREIFIQHALSSGWGAKRDQIEQAWDTPGKAARRRWLDAADAVLTAIAQHADIERDDAKAELIDLRALFDLQQTRMAEATAAWQAEDPEQRESVLPDLGDLLTWLLRRIERAETILTHPDTHELLQHHRHLTSGECSCQATYDYGPANMTHDQWMAHLIEAARAEYGIEVRPPTQTTVEGDALLTAQDVPDVDDCYFRMLEPHEIQAGMAFLTDYIVLGNKRERVRQLGNAVTPPAARDLIAAVVEAITGEEVSPT